MKNRACSINRSGLFIKPLKPVMAIGIAIVSLLSLVFGVYHIIHSANADAITPPTILGEVSYQKYDSHSLGSNAKLMVNVANGNVILDTSELSIKSVGPSLSLSRYFNGRATGFGQNGSHGTFSMGSDVTITANSNGSATYKGPSGTVVTYPSNGSGGYTLPPSYTAAKLAKVTGGGWKLTFNKSGEYYQFNAAGKQIKHSNADGQFITFTYNSNGTLNVATDSQGHTLTFSNYTGTYVGKVTDNSGRNVNYTYDSGKLTKATDANGNFWTYQYYDTRDNLNQITDPRGYTTTLSYDSSNRVTNIKYNDFTSNVTEWKYTYDNTNAKTVVTNPLNHATTYTYDAGGKSTQVKNAVGSTNGSTWDANNNQTASTDPSNSTTTSTYDSNNNVTSTQNPTQSNGNPGAKTSYTYTDAAHPYQASSSKSAQGNITSFSYNTNGNLSSSSSGSGTGAVAVTYKREGDSNGSGGTITCTGKKGQVCSSVDGKGITTTYVYDSKGNLLTINHPAPLGKETFTYDALSRVRISTDGNGSTVTTDYDNMDRPIKKTWASDGKIISYQYDKNGNLIDRTETAGQTLYAYDGLNRVTQLKQYSQPNLDYTYDKAGNLKTEVGAAGTATYAYDAANQVTGVKHSATGANNYAIAYTAGRPTTVTLPGGITQTISYDKAGRQTSIKAVKGSTVLTNYTASYTNATGADNQLMQTEKDNITGITTTYSYDGLERLVGAAGSGTGSHSYTYAYDANGNRTQTSKDGVYSAIYGYNNANQLTTAGGASYGGYDKAGNQTSNGAGLAVGHNAQNQATSFTPVGGATQNASYLNAGQTSRTSLGATTYQNGLQGLYSEKTGSTTTGYVHLPGGTKQTIFQLIGNTPYYYLTDVHGSTVKMTNGSGTVVNTYTYDPYGRQLSRTGTTQNNIKYSNGYQDVSTGLYKYGARYYNVAEGRWTQPDPSGIDAHYVYTGNDPVNSADPSGYCSVAKSAFSGFVGGAVGGAVTGGVGGLIAGSLPTFGFGAPIGLAGGAIGGAFIGGLGGYVGGGTTCLVDNLTNNT